jgi:hypothetical protein
MIRPIHGYPRDLLSIFSFLGRSTHSPITSTHCDSRDALDDSSRHLRLLATTSIESRHSRRNRTPRTDVPSHLIRLSTGPNPSAIRSDMFHMGFKGLSVLVWKVLGPSRRFIAIFLDFRTSLWTASSLTYLFRNLFIFSLHPWSFCYSFGRYFVLFYYLVWLYPSLIIFSINTPSKFQ